MMGGGHPGCSGVTTALAPKVVSIKALKGALPRLPPANRYCAFAVCANSATTMTVSTVGLVGQIGGDVPDVQKRTEMSHDGIAQ